VIRRGIFWGVIISTPFWVLAIWLIKSGVIALKTLIIIVLILSAPYIFLIMRSPQNNEQDKQNPDLLKDEANDDAPPAVQSANHHRDPSDTGTPG
jgi:hypothetical protein